MHPIIVSRLIESNYQVFIPVGGGSELLLKDSSGNIKTCKARIASTDTNHSSVLKSVRGFDVIAVYDPVTQNVWVIPSDVLEDLTAIRLGKKYDDYLVPEPRSVEFKERKKDQSRYLDQLKERAVQEAQKGNKDD